MHAASRTICMNATRSVCVVARWRCLLGRVVGAEESTAAMGTVFGYWSGSGSGSGSLWGILCLWVGSVTTEERHCRFLALIAGIWRCWVILERRQ